VTDGPATDYQPDWSPTGHFISMHPLKGKRSSVAAESEFGSHAALTHAAASTSSRAGLRMVRRVVYVSTATTVTFTCCRRGARGTADHPVRLTGETKTRCRATTTALRPRDQPDLDTRRPGGPCSFPIAVDSRHRRLVARASGSPAREAVELRYEETTGRPTDFSPHGQRIVVQLVPRRNWLSFG